MAVPNKLSNKGDEQQLAGLSYLQQLYQNQYNSLNQSINGALERLADTNSVNTVLENIGKVLGNQILTPIGSDTYIFSTANAGKTVLVHVGANYVVEKTVDEAKNFISKQIETQTAFINQLIKNKSEVENALLEVSYQLNKFNVEE